MSAIPYRIRHFNLILIFGNSPWPAEDHTRWRLSCVWERKGVICATMKKLLILLMANWAGLSLPVAGFAQVLLQGDRDLISAGSALEIFRDSSGDLTFDQIRSQPVAGKFIRSGQENPNLGYTTDVVWARLIVRCETESHRHWVLEVAYPNLDHLTVFQRESSGRYAGFETGDRLPFSSREIKHRNFVFTLHVQPSSTDTVFFRIASEGALSFPVVLRTEDNFKETDHESQLAFGFYYGIFLSLMLYNFLLFLSIRDKNYLLYVGYIATFLILQMIFNGLAYEYLWPGLPGWNNVSLIVFIGLVYACSLWFTTSFLNLKQFHPVFYKVMKGLRMLGVLLAVLAFFVPYHQMVMAAAFMTLLVAPSILIASVYGIRKKYRPAWFFLSAWILFLVGMTLFALKNFGVLPVNFLTTYGLQIGAAIEIILLSLALADRINLLKSELEETEKEKQKLEMERFLLARQVTIGILHEIRQPLQIIRGILDVMELPEETTREEKKQYIFKAQSSVGKINRYLQRLEQLDKGYFKNTRAYTRDEKMIDLSEQDSDELSRRS